MHEPDYVAFCALHHVCTGRPDLAIQLMDKAELLNPCVPHWYLSHRGYALHALRRYDEAAQSFERQTPRPYWDTCFLAACYTQLGRAAEARGCIADALREMPDLVSTALAERIPHMDPSDVEHLLEGLRQAGFPAPDSKSSPTDTADKERKSAKR